MSELSMKKVVRGDAHSVVGRVTEVLKEQGFGVLTRIDLDAKIKEKLGKEVAPVVILGACNPKLAYEAYLENPDVTGLLPCNAVLRQVGADETSVEFVRPTQLMEALGDQKLVDLSRNADELLEKALKSL